MDAITLDPGSLKPVEDRGYWYVQKGRLVLAEVCDCPQAEQLARLIAAAPDLLAACEAADVVMDTAAIQGVGSILGPAYRDSWAAAHAAVRAAIAKAKGG